MNHEPRGPHWWNGMFSRCEATPQQMQELADRCEALGSGEQRSGFERALRLLADIPMVPHPDHKASDPTWISLLADSGAYESAALALVPPSATYTAGRLADGAFTAQVILPGGVGAHSRQARSMAMAVIAALMRALARERIEQRAAV